jgi:hypothetical protein
MASNITLNNQYIQLPDDTTANRPGSPATGMIRFNTTTTKVETYITSAWKNMLTSDDVGFGLLHMYEDSNGGLNTDFVNSTQSLDLTDPYQMVHFNNTATAYSIDSNGNLVVTI